MVTKQEARRLNRAEKRRSKRRERQLERATGINRFSNRPAEVNRSRQKRKRPREHTRRMKNGKKTTVNRGMR